MASVMEKARYRLVQSGKADIANDVDRMHKMFQTQLNSGNIQDAKNAENFLNWLLFDKEIPEFENNLLNAEYKQYLIDSNPAVSTILLKLNEFDVKNKLLKEKAQSDIKLYGGMSKEIQSEFGKFTQQRGTETETLLVDLINSFTSKDVLKQTGTDQSTVFVKKWVQNTISNLDNIGENYTKKLVKDNKYLRYAGKSMKADTSGTGEINYIINFEEPSLIQSCINVFSNASLKSVNNIEKIHLENVDILKAYSAFMNFAYSNRVFTQKAIKNIFNSYYGSGKTEDYEYVTRHLNHLFRVYAYSGFGTSIVGDIKDISKGVSYLVVIDNTENRIHIKTSKEVIDFLLQDNNSKLASDVFLNLASLMNKS